MTKIFGIVAALAIGGGLGVWANFLRPGDSVKGVSGRAVGTHPGGVGQGKRVAHFEPAPGDSLVGFSAGCFWGSEEAFRKKPGIVATAVGYTGGSSSFPTYEQAHGTGHLETVLVEFNPKRTPFAELLKTFWILPRTMNSDVPDAGHSSYQAAIWTYGSDELTQAEASRDALERKLHRKLRVQIQAARPFYLAEEYHQQYDEKAGRELCPVIP